MCRVACLALYLGANPSRMATGALLRELYEGETRRAVGFRYGLVLFDLLTISFLAVTSFVKGSLRLELIDAAIGVVVLGEFLARLSVSRRPLRDLLHPLGLADIAVIISFLAPVGGHGLGFLRALRVLRLFRSYRVASRMQRDFPFVRRNYDTIVAGTNLFVFLFGMTAVVFETQHRHNPAIGNYLDALYFTVATLTTTGFGDITLTGTEGRLLAIVMMIVGVSLFVRMVQVLFRSRRVHSRCLSCGLAEHESDAAYCKRCGTLLTFEPKPGLADPACMRRPG
jgi:voltage-gated potassium channel